MKITFNIKIIFIGTTGATTNVKPAKKKKYTELNPCHCSLPRRLKVECADFSASECFGEDLHALVDHISDVELNAPP